MKTLRERNQAFTLVELMIVVGIIAVIVGIGVPSWMRARETAQRTAVINEMRNNVDAFQTYASEQNGVPPTSALQILPEGMMPYMPKNSTWTASPQGGGYWCWLSLNAPVNGFTNFVAIYNSCLSQTALQEIDNTIDDGNLASGAFFTQGVDTSGSPEFGNGNWMFMGVQGYSH
jgi:prepilin-type N-terminal cleavage/methylation domain-containing protein